MAWVTLANNQWVSRADLQNAVSTGVFTLKAGQTIPAGNNWVTRSQVETWINATVTSGTSVQWPQKSWIIPVSTTTTSSTSSTTTTTTTLAGPWVTVTYHNDSPNTAITLVHGSGYNPNYTYNINLGQSQTDTHWPVSTFTSGGCYFNGTANPPQRYKLACYKNSVFVGDGTVTDLVGVGANPNWHAVTPVGLIGASGDVFDIHLVPSP